MVAQSGEAVVSPPEIGPTCPPAADVRATPILDADLDAEREPRPDAGIDEAKARMYVVLV